MVEGTFPDGTFLVSVHSPICTPDGNLAHALYGSGLVATPDLAALFRTDPPRVLQGAELPGAIVVRNDAAPIVLCEKRKRVKLRVTNTGDRPIQVGSREFPMACIPSLHNAWA